MRRPASRRVSVRVENNEPIRPLQALGGRGRRRSRETGRRPPTRCRSSPRPGRPRSMQAVDHLGDRRVPPSHRRLEIVTSDRAARRASRRRLCGGRRDCPARRRGPVLVEPAVRVGGRHAERRLDDDDAESRDVVDADRARRRGRRRARCRLQERTARRRRASRRAASSVAARTAAPRSVFRPTSAAAASALPPPRPAATGISLSSRTCTSRGSPACPAASPERVAARHTRFVRSAAQPGARVCKRERAAPRGERQRVGQGDRLQQRPDVVIAVGRRGPTRSVRLILAEGRSVEGAAHVVLSRTRFRDPSRPRRPAAPRCVIGCAALGARGRREERAGIGAVHFGLADRHVQIAAGSRPAVVLIQTCCGSEELVSSRTPRGIRRLRPRVCATRTRPVRETHARRRLHCRRNRPSCAEAVTSKSA